MPTRLDFATNLKVISINITALIVSVSNVIEVLQIILLGVSIGYTLYKWREVYLKKNNSDEK